MTERVFDAFDELIRALDDEGNNEDIKDDVGILKRKYIREK